MTFGLVTSVIWIFWLQLQIKRLPFDYNLIIQGLRIGYSTNWIFLIWCWNKCKQESINILIINYILQIKKLRKIIKIFLSFQYFIVSLSLISQMLNPQILHLRSPDVLSLPILFWWLKKALPASAVHSMPQPWRPKH